MVAALAPGSKAKPKPKPRKKNQFKLKRKPQPFKFPMNDNQRLNHPLIKFVDPGELFINLIAYSKNKLGRPGPDEGDTEMVVRWNELLGPLGRSGRRLGDWEEVEVVLR